MKNKKRYIGGFKNKIIIVYSVNGVHSSTRECRKNPTAKATVTNSMVLELRMKLRLLFSRVVCFGLKDHLLLQRMISECAEVTVGFMMIGYMEKGGLVITNIEKIESMTVHREGHSKEMTNFINRVCDCHESHYLRINIFGVLFSNFCGSWNKSEEHKMFFEGYAVLVQYDMENGHLLMEA